MWPALNISVDSHEGNVAKVAYDHDKCLVPKDLFVNEYDEQDNDSDTINETIPGNWVPIQRDFVPAKHATDSNNTKNVENSTAHNGTDPQVALGDKCPHDVGKELRGTGA